MAHRLLYHSTIGLSVIKKKETQRHRPSTAVISASSARPEFAAYRGTSLIRNTPFLGPYSRSVPRVLWSSQEEARVQGRVRVVHLGRP